MLNRRSIQDRALHGELDDQLLQAIANRDIDSAVRLSLANLEPQRGRKGSK